ncbi:hypothetical protein KAH81_09865, partial [bacterium]|nr:hypothetical protein [bacterium]
LYRVDFYYLRLAYNLWFGMSSNGRFYNEAWDEWMDLIDHIHYIELFTPQDPAYFRIGLIENLFFGHGMLVNNYNNAVFLPFEKKNGLQMTFNLNSTKTVVFTNNIANPRVFGLYFGWQADKRFYTDFTFIGDVDQFNDIEDTDGDSYPDEIDPQPDVYNYSQDSVLTGFPVQSLDDYDSRGIYGAALGMKYKFLRGRHFSGVMSGEMAGLSNKSMGVTFPNLGLNIRWFSLSAGLDFQTPHFSDGIFDRSYEKDKARFIDNGEGSLELVTRANQLEEAEGWLYGWNNSFSVQIPKYFRIRTSFRDIYRDNDRDKKFALSLDIDYPIFKYVTRTSFFIEQKNVSYLFQKKTDGESCGLGFRIKPHNTITINIRYRERYTDSDANGVIEKDETERNFDGNAIIDGNYWWKKFLEWRRKKKAEKELNTPSSKAAIF